MATKKQASNKAPECPDCAEKAAAIADLQNENESLKKGINPAQVAAVAKSEIEAANKATAKAVERANNLQVDNGRLQSTVDRLERELQKARAVKGSYVA
jgi:hypothetical protein